MDRIDYQIATMKAFSEGKRIESKEDNESSHWAEDLCPTWDWVNRDYRVKSKSRTYVDVDELFDDYCERFGKKRKSFSEPIVWLKNKKDSTKHLIISFSEDSVTLDKGEFDMEDLFYDWTYLDDSDCGAIL